MSTQIQLICINNTFTKTFWSHFILRSNYRYEQTINYDLINS